MSKTVVVIGGTTGIGFAIARGFAEEVNTKVLVTGHEPMALELIPNAIEHYVLDVRDAAKVTNFFSGLKRLDVLVNCAGIIRRNGEEFMHEGFSDVVDVNLNGTLRCCEAAKLLLAQNKGCVINTASMLTYFGSATSPAYAASKVGVGQLTKSLAVAWAGDGIRVNALAPGWIATNLTAALSSDDARSAVILGRTPMKRWGQPCDLSGPAIFLASKAAAFITGAIIPVDGGYSAA